MNTKIMPVTDLRQNTSEVIRQIRQTNEIVYVTQHGRPSVVLLDYRQYEAMVAQLKKSVFTQQNDAVAILQSWIDEGDEEEQTATREAIIKGLDEYRLSDRKLFPAELKGITW